MMDAAAKPKRAVTSCSPPSAGKTIRLCMKKTGKPSTTPILSAKDVCNYLKKYAQDDREALHVIHMNVRDQVTGHEEVARGTLTEVVAHPREIFKGALLNNANSIILAHNHPSGQVDPSQADKELTQRIADSGVTLGVPLRDHVVFAAGRQCYSFRENQFPARFGDGVDASNPSPRVGEPFLPLREKNACPPGCRIKKDDGLAPLWWTLGIIGVPLGALVLWKWRQINASGVPMGFALRRTFSKNIGEGHIGLLEAWRARKAA